MYTTGLEPLAWAIMPLNPGAALHGFGAALSELLQNLRRKGSRFTGGQNASQGRIQLRWWWLPKHGDMVDAVELEAVHRHVDGAGCRIDGFLGPIPVT